LTVRISGTALVSSSSASGPPQDSVALAFQMLGASHGLSGCGRLKGNRHIMAKDTTSNLLLALAHLGSAEIDSLPASTGRLEL
jgi:hypothetical protein